MILYGLLLYYLLLLCCFVDLASSQDIPLINPFTGAVIKQTEEDRPRQLVVIVTGASSGIGKDTVLEFAKNKKFKVYATMRDIHKWTPDSDSYGKGTIAVNHADHPTSTYDPHLSTEDSEKKERDRERRKQDRLSQKDTLHVEVESGYNNVVLLNMDVTDDKSVQRAVGTYKIITDHFAVINVVVIIMIPETIVMTMSMVLLAISVLPGLLSHCHVLFLD